MSFNALTKSKMFMRRPKSLSTPSVQAKAHVRSTRQAKSFPRRSQRLLLRPHRILRRRRSKPKLLSRLRIRMTTSRKTIALIPKMTLPILMTLLLVRPSVSALHKTMATRPMTQTKLLRTAQLNQRRSRSSPMLERSSLLSSSTSKMMRTCAAALQTRSVRCTMTT